MKLMTTMVFGLIIGGCASAPPNSFENTRLPAQTAELSSYTCSQILNANTGDAITSVGNATITITKGQDSKISVQIVASDTNGQSIKLYPYNGFDGDPSISSADPDKCYNVGPIQSEGSQITIESPCLTTINEGRGSYRSLNKITLDTQANTVSFVNSLRWCASDLLGKCSALHGPFVNQVAITMKCQKQ